MKTMLLQKVPSADGVELATDVYLPDGPGPFPALLTRTPYHRRGISGAAERWVGWGYARVIQDCRGKYDSTGVFRPLEDEAVDGAAAIDWIANQRWCNGRVGLIGASYLGMVQVPAAARGHEALRCICPSIAPNTFFTEWIRLGGCFALANAIRWPMTHAACATMPAEKHFAWADLWRQPTLRDVFDKAGYECAALKNWVEHDVYDDYWRQVDQHPLFSKVAVPGLHPAGWCDHVSNGQYQAYRGIRDGGAGALARRSQRLFVGPWGHLTFGKRQYGEWDFGPEAEIDHIRYVRRFVDLWMKDADDGFSSEPPVRLFVMGLNRWMSFADWPPPQAQTQAWHLRGKGGLSLQSAGGEESDHYRYDPRDPVPTRGGPIYWGLEDTGPAGPVDQRAILDRKDVLLYRGEPLEKPLAVIGDVHLELTIASDAADTDFVAKLCVVEATGRVTPLTVGSLRCRYRNGWDRCEALEKDSPTPIRIAMGNLAYVFPVGSRVALLLTSSCWPRILPNPNTMAPAWQERSPVVAEQTILHDRAHPSRLLLPVVEL